MDGEALGCKRPDATGEVIVAYFAKAPAAVGEGIVFEQIAAILIAQDHRKSAARFVRFRQSRLLAIGENLYRPAVRANRVAVQAIRIAELRLEHLKLVAHISKRIFKRAID